jgi:hypothetical protein
MRIRALALLAFLVSFSHAAEGNTKEFLQSYTSEEMHRIPIRGYVAAALDHLSIGTEQINECASKYRLNEIAARSAALIESSPSDREMISAVEVHSAIIVACDAVKRQQ